jgi:hypothetical protein
VSRAALLVALLGLASCHLLLGHHPPPAGAGDGARPERVALDAAHDHVRADGVRADAARADGSRADGARADAADGPNPDQPHKKDGASLPDPGGPDLGPAAGTVAWAKGIGGPSSDYGRAVAVDPAGNVYVAGGFTGTVDFNPGGAAKTLTSLSGMDAFVASYTSSGALRWAQLIASTAGVDVAYGVAADASTVFVTGAAGSSPFVAARPSSGQPGSGWLQTWTASGAAAGWSLALDASSNLYLAGFFTSTLAISGGSTFSAPAQAGFYASLTPGGAHRWSHPFEVAGKDVQLRSVAVAGTTLYLAGYAVTTSAAEGRLLTCAAATGLCTVTDLLGPPGGSARALGVATAGSTVYLTGSYTSGAYLVGSKGMVAAGKNDLFTWSSEKSTTLALGLGSPLDDVGNAVAASSQGAYIVGQLGAASTNPPLSAGIVVTSMKGGVGLPGFPLSFGGATDVGHGVALDPGGKALYLVGTYSSATLKLGNATLSCNGCTGDIVLARLAL